MTGIRTTVYVHGGSGDIAVEVMPDGRLTELVITIDGVETEVSLTRDERRQLIRALDLTEAQLRRT